MASCNSEHRKNFHDLNNIDQKINQNLSQNFKNMPHWWNDIFVQKQELNNFNYIAQQIIKQNTTLKTAQANSLKAKKLANIQLANSMPLIQISELEQKSNTQIGFSEFINLSKQGIQFNWEMDLFGAKRKAYKALKYGYLSTESQKQHLINLTIFEGFTQLISWQNAYQNYLIYQKIISLQNKSLQLNQTKFNQGLQDYINVQNAEASLKNNQINLHNILNLRHNTISKILEIINLGNIHDNNFLENILIKNFQTCNSIFNTNNQFLQLNQKLQQTQLICVEKRPDVISAWQNLIKYDFNLISIKRSFFPNISLAGFLGLQYISANNTVPSANNPIGSLSLNSLIPNLNFWQIKQNIDIAKIDFYQAFIDYQNTYQIAINEIHTALANYTKDFNITTSSWNIYKNWKNIHDLNITKFNNGLIDEISLINSEINLLQAQISLTNAQNNLIYSYLFFKKSTAMNI